MTTKYIPFESKSGFKSPEFLVDPTGEITGKRLVLTEGLSVQNISLSGVDVFSGADSTLSLGDGVKNSYLERVGTLQYLNIDGDFTVSQGSTPYISVVNGEIRITNPEYADEQLYSNITQTLTGTINNTGGIGAVFDVIRTGITYTVSVKSPGKNFQVNDYIIIPGTWLGGQAPEHNLTIKVTAVMPSPLDNSGIMSIQVIGSAQPYVIGSINNFDIGLTTAGKGKFTSVESTGNLSVAGDAIVVGDLSVAGSVGTLSATSISINTAPTEVYHATRKDYVDQRISAFSIAFGG